MEALLQASVTDSRDAIYFNERHTVHGIPHKHGACLEATTNFFNPFVIERHPLWPLAVGDVARFSSLPEVFALEILV
jgi:hypothetical protein